MTMAFEHTTLGQRVLFGAGSGGENLEAELERLAVRSPMVVSSGSARKQTERLTAGIAPALWWDEVVMHVPLAVAERARTAAETEEVDCVVSVGGGSAIGLAKAVALTRRIPVIAVPTTYSGSEATNVWGLTDEGTKTTGIDPAVLPVTVIYDAQLTATLPTDLSVVSGLNALAHCVDSLWAPRADPINEALALEGANALARALPGIVRDPVDIEARERALYGCYLAAVAFTGAGSGLHHKICHVLGGTFNLPHAQTHAIVLPHVLAFNAASAVAPVTRLAAALCDGTHQIRGSSADAITALRRLYDTVDAPRSLVDFGFRAEDIPEAVRRIVSAAPESNPTEVTAEGMTRLLTAALTGQTEDGFHSG